MRLIEAVWIMKSKVEYNPQEPEVFRSLTSTVPGAEILASLLLRHFEQNYSHPILDLTHRSAAYKQFFYRFLL
jgi:hypothetical protein